MHKLSLHLLSCVTEVGHQKKVRSFFLIQICIKYKTSQYQNTNQQNFVNDYKIEYFIFKYQYFISIHLLS